MLFHLVSHIFILNVSGGPGGRYYFYFNKHGEFGRSKKKKTITKQKLPLSIGSVLSCKDGDPEG